MVDEHSGMETQLKQRLVGAIVVSALAVIFLPMIFDEQVDLTDAEDFSIPEFPQDFENDSLEIPKQMTVDALESNTNEKEKKAADTKALTKPAESKQMDKNLSAWVVQAGSFSEEKNANLLRDRLRKAGYPAFVESAQGTQKAIFRVRVGPELDRNRADRYLKKIKEAFAIDGLVVSYP